MPYKNPEDKRRWEKEHRERRNASRRAQRLNVTPEQVPASTSDQPKNGWTTILGLAVGIGVALLGTLSGVHLTKTR